MPTTNAESVFEERRETLEQELEREAEIWTNMLEISVRHDEISSFADDLLKVIDEHRCPAPSDHLDQTKRAIERLQKELNDARKARETELERCKSNGGNGESEAWREHVSAMKTELNVTKQILDETRTKWTHAKETIEHAYKRAIGGAVPACFETTVSGIVEALEGNRGELEQIKRERDETREQNDHLIHQLKETRKHRNQLAELANDVDRARSEASFWKINFHNLASTLDKPMESGTQPRDVMEHADALKRKVEQLEKERDEERKLATKKLDDNYKLHKLLDRFEAENEQLEKERREYRDKCSEETELSSIAYQRLEEQCAKATKDVENLERLVEGRTVERDQALTDWLATKQEVVDAAAQIAAKQAVIDSKTRELDEMTAALASLQKRHDLRKSTIEKWKASEASKTTPGLFAVWNIGKGKDSPTNKHDTLKAARTEAERLAKATPGYVFVVLKGLSAVKAEVSAVWSELELESDSAPSDAATERDCNWCQHGDGDDGCKKRKHRIYPGDCEFYDDVPF